MGAFACFGSCCCCCTSSSINSAFLRLPGLSPRLFTTSLKASRVMDENMLLLPSSLSAREERGGRRRPRREEKEERGGGRKVKGRTRTGSRRRRSQGWVGPVWDRVWWVGVWVGDWTAWHGCSHTHTHTHTSYSPSSSPCTAAAAAAAAAVLHCPCPCAVGVHARPSSGVLLQQSDAVRPHTHTQSSPTQSPAAALLGVS